MNVDSGVPMRTSHWLLDRVERRIEPREGLQ
jgi:hypothetical protein